MRFKIKVLCQKLSFLFKKRSFESNLSFLFFFNCTSRARIHRILYNFFFFTRNFLIFVFFLYLSKSIISKNSLSVIAAQAPHPIQSSLLTATFMKIPPISLYRNKLITTTKNLQFL